MRIALSLALVAVLAAACSKKEDAAKIEPAKPEVVAPAAPAGPAVAAADIEGPKPGKWKTTTVLSAAPKPIVVESCVVQTSFKDMEAA
ncbi:MAG: hypothetical protein ACREEO_15575 [Phenylobacterium sp.]